MGEDHPDYAASLNNLAALYETCANTRRRSHSYGRRWRFGNGCRAKTTLITPQA